MSDKPASCDLILTANALVSVTETFTAQNSIAIKEGKIIAIDSFEQLSSQYQCDNVHSLPHHILMPGLINAHGHSAMSLLRGFADDMPLMDWLENKIWPLEQQFVDPEFVFDGSQLAIAEMLRSGTTCFSDMYFFPDACAQAVQQTGIKAQLSFPVFDFPSAWGNGPDDYLSKGEALIQQFSQHSRLSIVPGPHAPYTVSDQVLLDAKQLANRYQTGLQMHLHETEFEVNDAVSSNGIRPIQRLLELGLLDKSFQAVHMTCLNAEDIAICRDTELSIVHCPISNLKLGSGFLPLQAVVKADINIALGTDGAASNNSLNMFNELQTAALIAKGSAKDPSLLPARQAIAMATLYGAKALGLEQSTGSIAVGKDADIIAIDISQLEQQPHFDTLSLLTYSNIGPRVSHSYVQGKCLMQDYQFTAASKLDIDAITARAKYWQDKIST